MAKKMSCPSCGAPLNITNRFVKMVACDFCAQTLLLTDSGLDPTGKTAKLADLGSPLYIDATGTLRGQKFQVLGRLRYQYDSGIWDEWFLTFDGINKPGWLVEDEGEHTFYHKETLTSAVPPFDKVAVGQVYAISGREVFVTQKGTAKILGGEGQLAFTITPGETVRYLDGNSGAEQISIEYTKDEIEFLVGWAVGPDDLKVDEEEF
jgi:hypothetical protein